MRHTDWKQLEERISSAVKLPRRAVAVSFLDAPPLGVKKFEGTEPSSCSFWRLAADGAVFYTVPENHVNCAMGAYTHNIALPPEREKEAEQSLKMMFDLGYVKPEEVARIPRLPEPPAVIVYAPLGEAAVPPDLVLFACKPLAAMLLSETANRAGIEGREPILGRPTCMALPASLRHGAILSLGCMGNRVYTGLGEEEMYFVLRAKDVETIADSLAIVAKANAALKDYAEGRCSELTPTE